MLFLCVDYTLTCEPLENVNSRHDLYFDLFGLTLFRVKSCSLCAFWYKPLQPLWSLKGKDTLLRSVNTVNFAGLFNQRLCCVHFSSLSLLTDLFPVVPTLVIHPLPNKLNGRLGTIHLQPRHVQIVNEQDKVFAKRRTKYTFTSETTKINQLINLERN